MQVPTEPAFPFKETVLSSHLPGKIYVLTRTMCAQHMRFDAIQFSFFFPLKRAVGNDVNERDGH